MVVPNRLKATMPGYDELHLDSDNEDTSSDDGTGTTYQRPKPATTWLRSLKLCWAIGTAITCIVTWAACLFLAWEAVDNLPAVNRKRLGALEPQAGTMLSIPGFALAYNTTYCNGVKDPKGARERDCVFDPVHGGWIPRLCHDPELTQELFDIRDYQWFEDEARTKPVSQEKVWTGEMGAVTYTSDDYHYRHCEYILKTLIKHGQSKRRGLGFKVLDEEHLLHCLDRLINYNKPEIREAQSETVMWTGSAECYVNMDY